MSLRTTPRVEVINSAGNRVRQVPGPLASAMVEAGHATARATLGRVRTIILVETAARYAERTGEPTGECRGVKFTRWEYLENGTRIVGHHPRCCWGLDD